jgi:pSer/pThr/pTyr-binding forkhead associated (FHA) protein
MPGGGSVGDTIGGDSGVAALLVLHPSGQRTRVSIDSTPFLIGRHADNHLVLRDNRASRNHARILAEGGAYFVEDLNSRHGTWVNGERVARRALHNSDRIDFGVRESYQLTFWSRFPPPRNPDPPTPPIWRNSPRWSKSREPCKILFPPSKCSPPWSTRRWPSPAVNADS